MKNKRRHKFKVTCYSRVSNWTGDATFKNYKWAKSFKEHMEKANFHCIMSTL